MSEPAIGQIVPCPGCNQPLKVPQPTQPSRQASGVAVPPRWSGEVHNGEATPDATMPLPPGMPPMPDDDPPPPPSDPLAFLHSESNAAPVDGLPSLGEARASSGAPLRRRTGPPYSFGSFSTGPSAALAWGLLAACVLTYGASLIGGMSQGFGAAFHSRRLEAALLATELMGLVGLLLFHYGLLLELACYGLWTFRRWGLLLAKILAVLQVIGGLIGFVAPLVTRTGIVGTLAGFAISSAYWSICWRVPTFRSVCSKHSPASARSMAEHGKGTNDRHWVNLDCTRRRRELRTWRIVVSTPSGSWYIRGEGNRPAGPFTADELIQSWRAGRLDANTICWREGMPQWLRLAQVEPFASVAASAGVPRQGTAGRYRHPSDPLPGPATADTRRPHGSAGR